MPTNSIAKDWAALNELVRQLERAPRPGTSPERRDLRKKMRKLGYRASEYGVRNPTRTDLKQLLDEGLARIVG